MDYLKKWVSENREKVREYQRRWREKNRDYISQKAKETYRKKHPKGIKIEHNIMVSLH